MYDHLAKLVITKVIQIAEIIVGEAVLHPCYCILYMIIKQAICCPCRIPTRQTDANILSWDVLDLLFPNRYGFEYVNTHQTVGVQIPTLIHPNYFAEDIWTHTYQFRQVNSRFSP